MPRPSPPLVGRAGVMKELRDALTTGSVVLAAAPGMGRTRVLDELASREVRGRVVRIRATASAAATPLAALEPLVQALPAAADDAGRLRGPAGVARALEEAGGTWLLLVDDAHLLDAAAAALLHHLVASGVARAVLAIRTPEEGPDAISALWKDGMARRIELPPLDGGHLMQVVGEQLGAPLTTRLRQHLIQEAAGNPRVLREALGAGRRGGTVVQRDGVWHLVRPTASDGRADARLLAVLHDRLAALDDDEREVLELLSLADPLRWQVLTGLAPTSAVTALEARGEVVIQDGGAGWAVGLTHPVIGHLVGDSLPAARRLSHMARLDAQLRAAVPTAAEEAVLARWALELGSRADTGLLLRGAAELVRQGEAALAAAVAELALPDGGPQAALIAGRAHLAAGDPEAALAVAQAVDRAVVPADLRVALVHVIVLAMVRTHAGAAALALLDAEHGAVADATARRQLVADRVVLHANEGRLGPAVTAAQPLLEGGLSADLRYLATPLGFALRRAGRLQEATRVVEAAWPDVGAGALPPSGTAGRHLLEIWGTLLLEQPCRWADLERTATAVLEATAVTDAATAGVAAMLLGSAAAERGQLPQAADLLAEAMAYLQEQDPGGVLALCLARRVVVTAQMGHPDTEALERAADLAAAAPRWVAGSGDLDRARLWVQALGDGVVRLGATPDVRTLHDAMRLTPLADRIVRLGATPDVRTVHDAMRLTPLADRDALHDLGARLPTTPQEEAATTASLLAAHLAAVAGRDGAGVLAAARRLRAAGATLLAAEALGQAAVLLGEQGRPASRIVAEQQLLLPLVDAARTPLIRGALAAPLPLRQQQVAALAALGLSNREIADRLVLSVRTVESHLYRAMGRLGVTDRDALRGMVPPVPERR